MMKEAKGEEKLEFLDRNDDSEVLLNFFLVRKTTQTVEIPFKLNGIF